MKHSSPSRTPDGACTFVVLSVHLWVGSFVLGPGTRSVKDMNVIVKPLLRRQYIRPKKSLSQKKSEKKLMRNADINFLRWLRSIMSQAFCIAVKLIRADMALMKGVAMGERPLNFCRLNNLFATGTILPFQGSWSPYLSSFCLKSIDC